MPGTEKITVGSKGAGVNKVQGKIALVNNDPKPKITLTKTIPPGPVGPFYYDVYGSIVSSWAQMVLTELELYDHSDNKLSVAIGDITNIYDATPHAFFTRNGSSEVSLLFDNNLLTNVEYMHFNTNVPAPINVKLFTIMTQSLVKQVNIHYSGSTGNGDDPAANRWSITIENNLGVSKSVTSYTATPLSIQF